MIPTVPIARQSAPARVAWLALGFLLSAGLATAPAEPSEGPAELRAEATNLLSVVSARYAAVTNLSCTVRREAGEGGGEIVSRVVFARGGLLNVETLSPEPRQVVVDGESAWTKGPGDKAPRRVPFEKQLPAQKASVLNLPASPEEAISALDPASATDRDAPESPWARQVVFKLAGSEPDAPGRAVVSLDGVGRIRALDIFGDADLRWRIVTYTWNAPVEAMQGVWLFGRSSTETAIDGRPATVHTRFDNLRANGAVAPETFDAKKVF